MEENRLLLDWEFWSVIVAMLAIILSQLPPIHILLKKAKLELEIHSRIYINHSVGNPYVDINLILRNTGGRVLRIKKIYIDIIRDNKYITKLNAETYFNPDNNQNILLTNFNLRPDEEWNRLVRFIKFYNRDDAKKFEQARTELKNEIFKQKQKYGKEHFAIADDYYVKPFNELLNKHFIWKPGDYELKINVLTNRNVYVLKKYRFIIFESMSNDLMKQKETYANGDGIYWFSESSQALTIDVEDVSS